MRCRLLAAAVSAAAIFFSPGARALEKNAILFATTGVPTLHGLPLVVALQRGYFADEGLKVEVGDFAGDQRAVGEGAVQLVQALRPVEARDARGQSGGLAVDPPPFAHGGIARDAGRLAQQVDCDRQRAGRGERRPDGRRCRDGSGVRHP